MDKSISFEDYCNQFTKEEVAEANRIAENMYPPQYRVFGNELHTAVISALEMARWKNNQLPGKLVDIDEVRESFMNTVYSVLSDDPTNDRVNDIINAFDNLPSITISNQYSQILANSAKTCEDKQQRENN